MNVNALKIYWGILFQGLIASLKDGFGFIRCADREARMFFHFSEIMDTEKELRIQEEVEFTVIQVKPQRKHVLQYLSAKRPCSLI